MSQDVMSCPVCGRRTPAARATCLYCGASLPVTKIVSAPPQRNIDNFERAFNTVLDATGARADESVEAALASALMIEAAEARSLIQSGKPVPIARSLNRQEADLIAGLVQSCGLKAVVIADEVLQLDMELPRARHFEVGKSALRVNHSSGVIEVPLDEIRLFVLGGLRNKRIDYTERASNASRGSGSVLETSEYHSDETLLDVYATSFEKSFRMKPDTFDYSGLVRPLSYRAEANFQAAFKALRDAAPSARLDEDFARVRVLLARAWPERSKVESRGVKRAGLAYRPVAQSSLVSDNRDQFDRYSRLMYVCGTWL